ncbi:MAG TPA: alpha/beta fold hydrolase [Gemmatimonadaceae bacterium]
MIPRLMLRLSLSLALSLALAGTTAGAQVATGSTGVAPPANVSVADLPLTEVNTSGHSRVFVVFLSGDGGWQALDEGVSAELSARGIPVIGLNSRQYLWSRKTPAQVAADLARIMTAYRRQWRRDSVVVVGYSRGAGIAPFAVNRLPAAMRGTVKAIALIGAEVGANFHFRLRDLLVSNPHPDDVPLMPEIRSLGATSVMCFYGEDEGESLCRKLAPPAIVVKMSGGHHLDGAYATIGQRIASEILK